MTIKQLCLVRKWRNTRNHLVTQYTCVIEL